MSNIFQREDNLGRKLRNFCDSEGRELFPLKSANILNELGLLYQEKSPDKISLIQSAVLLNAAIVRQPSNVRFQNDLNRLCSHVLYCAKASKQNANLVDISTQAKQMVVRMRESTIVALENIKRIPDSITLEKVLFELEKNKIKRVRAVQDQIAKQYTDVMSYISKRCTDILGTPPCKYALIGMGSLARKEITPYSDFEHIIVLENIKHRKKILNVLEYFRWYSTIFHIIVINLQETIIPSVCIRCLNDFSKPKGNWFYDKITIRGISFDGMMPHACKFPLGRTQPTVKKAFTVELIKPVSEMVRYLDAKEDLKNGYNLGDILTKTCYVSGDKSLYKLFLSEILLTQESSQKSLAFRRLIVSQLTEDLTNFSVDNLLQMFDYSKTINIKRVVYRSTTLFISALGRIYRSRENSNFAIIDEFLQHGKIDEAVAHKLSLAIALACHIRLYQYMSKKSQEDCIFQVSGHISTQEKIQELLKVVNKREFVDYFSTVYCLQNFIGQKTPMLEMSDMFTKNPIFARLHILQLLRLYDDTIDVGERYLQDRKIETEHDISMACYVGIAWKDKLNYQKSLEVLNRAWQSPCTNTLSAAKTWMLYYHIVCSKLYLKNFEEVSNETNLVIKSMKFDNYTFNFFMPNGIANNVLGRYHVALSSFRNFKNHLDLNAFQTGQKLLRYAIMLMQVSHSLLHTGHPQRALSWIFEAVEIFDQTFVSLFYKHQCYQIIASIYSALGHSVQVANYSKLHFEKLSGQLKQMDPIPNVVFKSSNASSFKKDDDFKRSIENTFFNVLNCMITDPYLMGGY